MTDGPKTTTTLLLGLGLAVVAAELILVWGAFIPDAHNGGDNAGYVALAHALLEGRGYVELWDPAAPPHTKYPPVFPLLLAGAIALGARTWTALKLVPAAFTVVASVAAYLWAARRRGPLFGVSVGVLTGASTGVLWYSHWILSDVPFLAFVFLALWALERGDAAERGLPPGAGRGAADAAGAPGGAGASEDGSGADRVRPARSVLWTTLGLLAALLAVFTRTAGLPLVVAVGAWLLLRRRWRTVAAFAVAVGVPGVLWLLRGRSAAAEGYVSEFWMVNPYRPELGQVGIGGLLGRVGTNLQGYVSTWVPEGLAGLGGGAGATLGLVLAVAAVAGWVLHLLRGVRALHAAELFFPLYAGLILLWPEVWSGDRFALPLFPLLLYYGGCALQDGAARLTGAAASDGGSAGAAGRPASARRVVGGSGGWAPVAVGAVATLVVLVPSLNAWRGNAQVARGCAQAVQGVRGGLFACQAPAWKDFLEAARWAGANLPEDAAVLSRKPRFFYVLGGIPSRTYPFTTDPDELRATADEVGARYVLLDALDRQGYTYVGAALQARPGMFCLVAGVRSSQASPGANLLGLVDPASGRGGALVEGPEGPSLQLPTCPPPLRPAAPADPSPAPGLVIPLLAR